MNTPPCGKLNIYFLLDLSTLFFLGKNIYCFLPRFFCATVAKSFVHNKVFLLIFLNEELKFKRMILLFFGKNKGKRAIFLDTILRYREKSLIFFS